MTDSGPIDLRAALERPATAGSDQRRFERTPVTLVVDYEGADDFISDYTENLSTGGTFIYTARALEIGEPVRLVLSFPGLLEPIALDGVVRWTRSEVEPGVGVEFLGGTGFEKLDPTVERIRRGDPRTVSRVVRVLVVEDNRHLSELLRAGLAGSARRLFGDALQFTVTTASNGGEAMQFLRSESFDAMIIEVYLPVIDGPSVIAATRKDLHLPLPIIAVSAGGTSARTSALAAGANMFLDKPMRLRQVIDTMRRLVDLGG
ncbi:MAG TPA: response regulator [Kofleriaceae bacterium]|jgi:uncharacterized protein (TIGR02266 family)